VHDAPWLGGDAGHPGTSDPLDPPLDDVLEDPPLLVLPPDDDPLLEPEPELALPMSAVFPEHAKTTPIATAEAPSTQAPRCISPSVVC
jgi:hypothetical protein